MPSESHGSAASASIATALKIRELNPTRCERASASPTPWAPLAVVGLSALLMLALLLAAASKIGVDVSSAVDEATWKCLQSPGGQGPVEFAVVRVYRSTGTIDPSGAATIKAARAAGIQNVDGYVFPCVTCAASPGAQVRAAVDALDAAGATIGMLWLDIERYEWSTNFTANAAFVTAMVDECHALSLSCGIYGGKNSWVAIFGSASAYTYPAAQGLPLWYAHYDNSPSFSDWTAYGGWRLGKRRWKGSEYEKIAASAEIDVDLESGTATMAVNLAAGGEKTSLEATAAAVWRTNSARLYV